LSRGVTSNPALEAWAARSIHETLLPSGTWVKVKVPDPEVLLRGDALPMELVAIARKFATKVIDTDELADDELLQYVAFTRELAAQTIRAIRLDGESSEWTEQNLHAADLDSVEPEDIEALRMIAFRRSTPAIVTAQTRAIAGALSSFDVESVRQREAGGTVDAYRDFRGVGPGAEPGADGADVRAEAERDDPAPRPRRRARG
jgi:hypothetical protein